MDMQSIQRPAKLQTKYKKRDQVKLNQVSVNNDKNCQSPMLIKSVCSDKNCQEYQNISMQPMKPPMDVQLPKPAV